MSAPRPVSPADGLFWITGASSGIGRALALELVRRGWRVVATARRADELAALKAEAADPSRLLPAPADVTDATGLEAAIAGIEAEHGPVVAAFLNAGLYLPVKALPFEASKFHKSFAVNLGGVVNGLEVLLPRFERLGKGQVAINASVAGYSGLPTSAAYGATKAGLINLCESLKFDLDRANILIQVVNPGFVETPATATNPFPMPFLVPVETAATRIADGMARGGFEITFPRRFAYLLKFLRILPYWAYFGLVGRGTGARP